MGYFAKIESGLVTAVVVANSASDCGSGTWVETTIDGSTRNKYAGIGDVYYCVTEKMSKSEVMKSSRTNSYNLSLKYKMPKLYLEKKTRLCFPQDSEFR